MTEATSPDVMELIERLREYAAATRAVTMSGNANPSAVLMDEAADALLGSRQEIERGGAQFSARVVPFSSVVGSSVTLHDDTGKVICQLSLLNTGPMNDDAAEWKRRQIMLATEVAGCINTHALVAAATARAEAAESALRLSAQGREEVVLAYRQALEAASYYIDRLYTAHAGRPVRDMEESGEAFYRLLGEALVLQPKGN